MAQTKRLRMTPFRSLWIEFSDLLSLRMMRRRTLFSLHQTTKVASKSRNLNTCSHHLFRESFKTEKSLIAGRRIEKLFSNDDYRRIFKLLSLRHSQTTPFGRCLFTNEFQKKSFSSIKLIFIMWYKQTSKQFKHFKLKSTRNFFVYLIGFKFRQKLLIHLIFVKNNSVINFQLCKKFLCVRLNFLIDDF